MTEDSSKQAPEPASEAPRPAARPPAAGTPNSQTPLVRDNKTVTTGESFWKSVGRFQPMR